MNVQELFNIYVSGGQRDTKLELEIKEKLKEIGLSLEPLPDNEFIMYFLNTFNAILEKHADENVKYLLKWRSTKINSKCAMYTQKMNQWTSKYTPTDDEFVNFIPKSIFKYVFILQYVVNNSITRCYNVMFGLQINIECDTTNPEDLLVLHIFNDSYNEDDPKDYSEARIVTNFKNLNTYIEQLVASLLTSLKSDLANEDMENMYKLLSSDIDM
jgi:hypothetical protein